VQKGPLSSGGTHQVYPPTQAEEEFDEALVCIISHL
jgi:hypothetical protein